MIPRTSALNGPPKSQPIVDPNGAPIDTQIYDQLGELARFIDTTLKTLTQFKDPMSATAEQLPEAVTHLRDLKRLTEEGTHKVMQQVEAIQDNHQTLSMTLVDLTASLPSPLDQTMIGRLEQCLNNLAADDKHLTEIITALSFQDLVAQRVNNLITIVDEVEHKLLELVVVFGPYTKGAGKAEAGKASEMLKQLEASKNASMNQDLADEILKQFGFN
jgi:chemotaxis protein CheZ